jgi:hypothetical protein
MIFHGNYFKLNTATEHLLYMAEHNELGKLEKKWLSNFYEKTAILSYKPTTLFRAEIDILAQRKHTCCCRSQNAFFFEFDCLRILLNQKNSASC